MARHPDPRCMACIQRSVPEARQQECWVESRCHRRRSHYRHRDRLRRQQALRQQQEVLDIDVGQSPLIYAAFLVLYRSSKDAPVHAIAAELWHGDQKLGLTPAIHTFGLKAKPQVQGEERIEPIQAVIAQLLERLRVQYGITSFEWEVIDLHPSLCPLRPCPLHPSESQ